MHSIWKSIFDNWDFYKIFLTTFVSGAFGGLINFFMTNDEIQTQVDGSLAKTRNYSTYRVLKNITIGVGAAFVVPLFLKIISSSLMDYELKENKEFFVYAGFCLIASIFSRRFLDSMAMKALELSKEAKETATSANQRAVNVEDLFFSTTDYDEELSETDLGNLEPDIRSKVKDDIEKVRKAFQGNKYAYRTSKGIAKDIGSDESVVKMILEELENLGFARKIVNSRSKKVLWTLTK